MYHKGTVDISNYKYYFDIMTIKNKFTLIKNDILKTVDHKKETMALLKKLLLEKDMTQQDLARLLHRDKTTISRWSNDSREINWENAVKIADALNIHPVEVYMPKKDIYLRWYVDAKYEVKMYNEKDQIKIRIPYEYYNKDVIAVQVNVPGSYTDGEIFLFDIPKIKKFSSLAIGKYCYCTSSTKYKKKNKNAKNVIGILKTNDDYSLTIINPITRKPINEASVSFQPEDLGIATPVKVRYHPYFLNQKVTT